MKSGDEYVAAIERIFDSVIRKIGDVTSCLICGSVAKGRVRPGKSDIIDGLIVLPDKFLESEESFYSALEAMTSACAMLADCNCPTHPFQYYVESEVKNVYPASLLAIWSSDVYGRCVRGTDIRSRMGTTPVSKKVTRLQCLSFFRSAQQLARFLGKRRFSSAERSFLLSQLRRYRKMVPLLACAGYGVWVENSAADQALRMLLPEVDCSILARLDALDASTVEPEDREVQYCLLKALEFFYSIQENICEYLRTSGELSFAEFPDTD